MSRFSGLRRVSLVGLALALVVGQGSLAAAQGGRRTGMRRYQNAVAEPTASPYLRLIQPGSDPGLNYFNLVQPQMQQQRLNQQQTQNYQALGRQLQQDERQGPFGAMTQMRATGGRAASFQNYSHYYPRMGGGGGGGGGGATPSRTYQSAGGSGGGMMGGFGGGF
ncbi:MAG TPA: hypothetical protein VG125_32445 [Pirellulales bacterium]|nr:hypothetical protein [Pirellulales bacterium]